MRRLSELTRGFARDGSDIDPEIAAITEDSRRVTAGALFVAVPGTAQDGHDYIDDAVARGACAVVAERRPTVRGAIPIVIVPSARAALAQLAGRFYNHPADDLTLVGFTGTFGKTSTSEVLRALLDAGGFKPGIIGSLGIRYGSLAEQQWTLTTPAPVELHGALAKLRDAGARQVIMEVTSHALRLGRVEGLQFRGGLIGAIMPGEHTDFHRTYEDYVDAKRLFLRYLSPDALVAYDADNRAARTLAREAQVARTAGLTLRANALDASDLLALSDVSLEAEGARFTVRGERLRSSLLGRGHVRNVGLALTYALAAGVSLDAAREVLTSLEPLPRRMERYDVAGRKVVDDTAGHPDSLDAAFEVASLIPHAALWVAYAVRGNRGTDINRRNAISLAGLAALHGASGVALTGSADAAGPADRATAAEIDAALAAFHDRGGRATWHDRLADAMRDIAARSAPGDLILLIGAQGMDLGRRFLVSSF